MECKVKRNTPAMRRRMRSIFIIVLFVVLIGFGAFYIYYSTGDGAQDPEGFESIRGLNNAEDMVQIGDTKWILAGNLGDRSWKKGGLYLIDSESLERKEANIDFSGAPAEGYEKIADPALFSAHGIALKPIDGNTFEVYGTRSGG